MKIVRFAVCPRWRLAICRGRSPGRQCVDRRMGQYLPPLRDVAGAEHDGDRDARRPLSGLAPGLPAPASRRAFRHARNRNQRREEAPVQQRRSVSRRRCRQPRPSKPHDRRPGPRVVRASAARSQSRRLIADLCRIRQLQSDGPARGTNGRCGHAYSGRDAKQDVAQIDASPTNNGASTLVPDNGDHPRPGSR